MYLSKATIKSAASALWEVSQLQKNGAYASHQLLWKLFSGDERSFLYREEQALGNGLPYFYILSKEKPMAKTDLFQLESKAFAPKLFQGQRLAFQLRVNPTVCITEDGKQKRHDVLMHAKYQAVRQGLKNEQVKSKMDEAMQGWISNEKRLQTWGIQLDSLPNIESYAQHSSRKKSGYQISFSSVDIQGSFTIVEPDRFYEQYSQGFGRAKSMGCGLMLIRRG